VFAVLRVKEKPSEDALRLQFVKLSLERGLFCEPVFFEHLVVRLVPEPLKLSFAPCFGSVRVFTEDHSDVMVAGLLVLALVK
jgi:hypothetical protein